MVSEQAETAPSRERGNKRLRFYDRFLGIPLVFLLSLIKRRRPKPYKVDRLALLKTAAIGDTVLLSAIVTDLRQSWPGIDITLFCGASNVAAARLLEGIDQVVCLPVASPLRSIKMMRLGFDLMIDFGQWPRLDALLTHFSAARFTIGFKTSGQARHGLYDAIVPHKADRHELENFRALLSPLGIRTEALPSIPHPTHDRQNGPVVLHMFPGGVDSHLKAWSETGWLELANHLIDQGCQIVVTGGSVDRAAALSWMERVNSPQEVRVVAGEMGLDEVVELLSRAELLVTVNTGIMHLAAAVDCPVVSLNGPTSLKRWGPVTDRAVSIQSPRPCSPCLNLGFDYGCPENHCMREISVEAVKAALGRLRQAPRHG